MSTFLFNEIIFGPVKSRRLGVSLGINLLPTYRKLCSFDCIYCECGFNPDKTAPKAELPTRIQVKEALQQMLTKMGADQNLPDVITFAGNGEPTLHPEFAGIIDDTIELRNQLCPNARVAVLSNATRIGSQKVFNALLKVDDNIQKLDSGLASTIQLLDQPVGHFSLNKTVEQLKQFNGHVIIQTLFVKGSYKGQNIDNTQPEELTAWLQLINKIAPREVMVYTIARDTPVDTLEKISEKELNIIADKIRELGIAVQVSA
ncbi:radical SAM protein [Geofilum sp. OHC36d9]|uniref:radical SAM protein n=1 Tax=Geofilum sp. OHC36d9 TaxID=3458413 RepID=UPI00403322C1